MGRFAFEPIDVLRNKTNTIYLIGFAPVDAEAWGDDLLIYLPNVNKAVDVLMNVQFTDGEIAEIAKVARDLD